MAGDYACSCALPVTEIEVLDELLIPARRKPHVLYLGNHRVRKVPMIARFMSMRKSNPIWLAAIARECASHSRK